MANRALRVSDVHVDKIRPGDVKPSLCVDVDDDTLDRDRAARTYRVELHTAAGCVASLDLDQVGTLIRELRHKLQVAAEMDGEPQGLRRRP